MASTINVGVLRAVFSADTAQYTMGIRKAGAELKSFQTSSKRTADTIAAGMSQAGKAASASSKLILGMGQAGQQAAAKQQAALQVQSQKAAAWGQMLQQSAAASAAAQAKAAQASMTWGQRLSQLGRSAASAAQSNAVFAKTLAGFTAANVVAGAIGRVASEIGEMAKVGERLPGMRRSFEQLAAGMGESADAMLGSLRMATKGLVTDFDLMQASNKAMLLGLPVTATEMGKLAQTATVLGRAMGQDATASLDDLITALGRSSPMILDNLGLTVKLGEANETYARKLGKTADELTDAEQKMAFYEAALRAAEQKVKTLGEVQLTLMDRLRQGRIELSNYVAQAAASANQSQTLNKTFDDGAEIVGLFKDGIIALGAAYRSLGGIPEPEWLTNIRRLAGFGGVLSGIADVARQARAGLRDAQLPTLPTSRIARSAFTPAFDPRAATAEQLEQAVVQQQNYVKQLEETRKKFDALTPAQRAQIAALDKLGTEVKGVGAQFGLTDAQLKMFMESTKKGSKSMSEAERNARQLAKELQDMRLKFSGAEAISEVEKLNRAFGGSIPIATMTKEAQREVAKTLYEGVDAWRAQGQAVPGWVQAQVAAVERLRIIPDILKDISESTKDVAKSMREAFFEAQRTQALETGSQMLAGVRAAEESRRSTNKAIEDMEFERAARVIEMAKQQGVAWQTVYAMERELAQRRLQATLRDLAIEHKARMALIDQSTPLGKAQAAQMQADYRALTEAMVADFEWGEQQKRRELQRTHSFWFKLIDQTKRNLANLRDSAISNLTHTLFGLGHDPDGSLKKAAKEAREAWEELSGTSTKHEAEAAKARQKWADAQKALEDAKARKRPAAELQELSRQVIEARVAYQEISKAGKGSAEEIQEAFDKMREAEEAAHTTFGKRLVDLWKNNIKPSIFQVFDDILAAFTRRFLDGMINAILGKRGGFAGAFGGLLNGGLGGILGGPLPGTGIIMNAAGGGAAAAAAGIGGASAGTMAMVGGIPAVAGTGAILGGVVGGTGSAATLAGGNILGTTPAAAGGSGGMAGLGAFLTNPWTAAAVGAAVTAMFVWKKGLFRGGWEGIQGNKRRDQHLAQWGSEGTGPGSGFHNLAAFLTSKTGQPGGGSIFKDFLSGDKKRFEAAQAAIVAMAASAGKKVKSFSLGGFVPPGVVQPAILHGGQFGELIQPMKSPAQITTERMSTGRPMVNINVHIDGVLDKDSVRQVFDQNLPSWIHQATLLNTGNVNFSLQRAVTP